MNNYINIVKTGQSLTGIVKVIFLDFCQVRTKGFYFCKFTFQNLNSSMFIFLVFVFNMPNKCYFKCFLMNSIEVLKVAVIRREVDPKTAAK